MRCSPGPDSICTRTNARDAWRVRAIHLHQMAAPRWAASEPRVYSPIVRRRCPARLMSTTKTTLTRGVSSVIRNAFLPQCQFINAPKIIPRWPLVYRPRLVRDQAHQEGRESRRIQRPAHAAPKRPGGLSDAAIAIFTRSIRASPLTARHAAMSRATPIIPATRMQRLTLMAGACLSAQYATSSRMRKSHTITAPTISSMSSAVHAASAAVAAGGGLASGGTCAP